MSAQDDINARAGKALAGRWRAGMRVVNIPRALLLDCEDDTSRVPDDPHPNLIILGGAPDMSDPCTRGGFLDVVRKAWNAPFAQASPRMRMQPIPTCNGWRVYLNDASDREFEGATESEALISALECAPVPK